MDCDGSTVKKTNEHEGHPTRESMVPPLPTQAESLATSIGFSDCNQGLCEGSRSMLDKDSIRSVLCLKCWVFLIDWVLASLPVYWLVLFRKFIRDRWSLMCVVAYWSECFLHVREVVWCFLLAKVGCPVFFSLATLTIYYKSLKPLIRYTKMN